MAIKKLELKIDTLVRVINICPQCADRISSAGIRSNLAPLTAEVDLQLSSGKKQISTDKKHPLVPSLSSELKELEHKIDVQMT
jgi:hypothetical protein